MNTSITGPSSSSKCFAQNFEALINRPIAASMLGRYVRFTVLVILLFTYATLRAAAPTSPLPLAPESKTTYTYTVSIHLSCPLSDGGSYSRMSLFEDNSGFDGFSDAITLESGRQVVTYTLSGPTSSLPGDSDVAYITVVDGSCGGTRNFIVRTDGIGSVLVMDEY